MQLKMMIVDDEPVCRHGISTNINWAAHGIVIVAEAENGREALEKALELEPDIVVTDIKMPVMNGIEFARELLARRPDTAVIILSAYAEFNFAREALALKIEDYLLRPFGADELLQRVLATRDQIIEKREQLAVENCRDNIFNENFLLLRSRFLQEIMHKKSFSPEDMASRCETLGICFKGPVLRLAVIDIDIYNSETSAFGAEGLQEMLCGILNIAEESFSGELSGSAFYCGRKQVAVIISAEISNDIQIEEACRSIAKAINRYMQLTVTVSFGCAAYSRKELPASYESACRALKAKVYLPKGSVINYKSVSGKSSELQYHASQQTEQKLLAALKNCDFPAFSTLFGELTQNLRSGGYSFESVKSFCSYLVSKAIALWEDMGVSITSELSKTDNDYSRTILNLEFFDELFDGYMYKLFSLFEQLVTQGKRNTGAGIIKIAIEYAKVHYMENISLEDVASASYISASYLSRMFTKETGETFTNWLNRYRIEKAKLIIQSDPEVKTYEVADMVGFNDYKYFSYIFKRFAGCLPRSYKFGCSTKPAD